MYIIGSYFTYLAISIILTVWVARTLFKNGRVFLVDIFGGNTALADSVNHLLVVGFYLINIGYVALALRYGDQPQNLQQSIEVLSTKVGKVMLILGAMHFLNLKIFSSMRKEAQLNAAPPPVQPQGYLAPAK
jgi:hypothetical protein